MIINCCIVLERAVSLVVTETVRTGEIRSKFSPSSDMVQVVGSAVAYSVNSGELNRPTSRS
jgi:hypothetical protein